MKIVGAVLVTVITVVFTLVIFAFSFFPQPKLAAQTAVTGPDAVVGSPTIQVVAPTADTTQLQIVAAEREATLQGQISQLEQALQSRQATYQEQIQLLGEQADTAQSRFNELQTQEQTLLTQVSELENARNERLAVYQSQLQEAQSQYTTRFAETQTLIDDLRTKLAEANAALAGS